LAIVSQKVQNISESSARTFLRHGGICSDDIIDLTIHLIYCYVAVKPLKTEQHWVMSYEQE